MSWKQKHDKLRDRVYKASGAKSIGAFDKQVTRAAIGLTVEEALFVLASKYGVRNSRGFAMLSSESRQRISSRIVQNVAVNTTTKNVKIDKRTLHINSPVHNLSFGDRNTLSQNVVNLDNNLAALIEQIDKSRSLTDDEKNDYKSDIQTVATQIGKSKPNRSIIRAAWESVKSLADVEGFFQLITRIAPLIQGFLS
jgi:hypothetical protein